MTFLALGSKCPGFGETALASDEDANPSDRSRCHKPTVPSPPANLCKKCRRLLVRSVPSEVISSPCDEFIQVQQNTADAHPNGCLSAVDSFDALCRKQTTPKFLILCQDLFLLEVILRKPLHLGRPR